MSDADAPLTRLFNRTTQPRVLEWGKGVVMPGESFLTSHPETYAPDAPGSAWTLDAEATGALLRQPQGNATNPSDSTADGHSEAARGLQEPNQGTPPEPPAEQVTVEPNGEIRNETGQVIGYVNPAAEQAANTKE